MENDHNSPVMKAMKKYMPSKERIIFHIGLIVLICLVIGLLVFQFDPSPNDLSENQQSFFRSAMGLYLALWLLLPSMALYIAWLIHRYLRAVREASNEVLAQIANKDPEE